MTANPYAPPTTDSAQGGTPEGKSFARRASFTLAAIGFGMFWVAAFSASQSDFVAGLGVVLAGVLHLVGIGVVFAAPPGRRLLPAVLNVLPLALIVVLVSYGLSKGAG